MGHAIIVGITETGKTTLAKAIAKQSQRKICVLEPVITAWEGNICLHTTDTDFLMEALKLNRDCDVFVDEGGETLQRDDAYQFLATRSRHYGHRVFFIAQRATQLAPIIRKNCTGFYCFRQCGSDCKLLGDDFAVDISQATQLKKGEYLRYLTLGDEVEKERIF